MKTLLFYTDTETTGLLFDRDQILTYAMIFSEKDQTLLEKEIKIKIKDNVYPNASALIINNINPFSKEYLESSVSEFEACNVLVNTVNKYKEDGYRIVFIAYNADFDVQMYRGMFKRCGFDFDAIFDSVFDPLIVAKRLVASGLLKTKEVEGFGGKRYRSSKLEDVYNALGYSSESITTHNALEDSKILKSVAEKLYLLSTGSNLDELNSVEEFKNNEAVSFFCLEEMDLVEKNVIILSQNDEYLFYLDFNEVNESKMVKNCIKKINKNLILEETIINTKKKEILLNFYNQNKNQIDEITSKFDLSENKSKEFHLNEFDEIKNIAALKKQNPRHELNDVQKNLEDQAEDYSFSTENTGWRSSILGKNFESKSFIYEFNEFTIELNRVGKFVLKMKNEEIVTEKKTEILEALIKNELLKTGTDEYKKVNAILIPVKNFKNPKHPNFLIKEFNDKKTEVFNGVNKLHKETLKGLMDHYKKLDPIGFNSLTIPEFKLNLNLLKKK